MIIANRTGGRRFRELCASSVETVNRNGLNPYQGAMSAPEVCCARIGLRFVVWWRQHFVVAVAAHA